MNPVVLPAIGGGIHGELSLPGRAGGVIHRQEIPGEARTIATIRRVDVHAVVRLAAIIGFIVEERLHRRAAAVDRHIERGLEFQVGIRSQTHVSIGIRLAGLQIGIQDIRPGVDRHIREVEKLPYIG